jgi:hypothetical protein
MAEPKPQATLTGEEAILELSRRVARLEASEEIRALKLRYASYCDAGYPPDALAELFTEDAVWDGDEAHFGVHRGRDAIRDFFAGISERFIFAMHYTLGGTIEVAPDLESASGRWYLWEPCTIVVEGTPTSMWVMGNYIDEYRRVDSVWRVHRMAVQFASISRADEGWTPHRFALNARRS